MSEGMFDDNRKSLEDILEQGVEVELKKPFEVVNKTSKEKEKVDHLILNSPSFYKKDKILTLRMLVMSKFMELAKSQAETYKTSESVEESSEENLNNLSEEEKINNLKTQFKVLMYSGAFNEQEFKRVTSLLSDILCTPLGERIPLNCLPALIYTESGDVIPFDSNHIIKLSADDWEEVMAAYIGNFITASLM